jgi:hypothetical protein
MQAGKNFMNYSRSARGACCAFLLSWSVCSADDNAAKVKIYDTASLEIGQVVKGTMATDYPESQKEIIKGWQQRFLYRFITDAQPTEQLRVVMDIEGQISFSYPQKSALSPESQTSRNLFNPIRIEGTYTLGSRESTLFEFGMGYFPYKFNPDAVVLGEYMYTTGTYPLFQITDYNHPYGKLLGFRLTNTLFGSFRQDLMLTSETLMFPTQDYSLSYLFRYSLARCLEIGAGINFSHLFSVNNDYTTGKISGAVYFPRPGDTSTTTFAFDGTKTAVQVSFDPKPLLPDMISGMLGIRDLRIYGEACVVGWEDRKNFDTNAASTTFKGYPDRYDRLPWMVGINIPAFKLFNVMAFELERFPNINDDTYRSVLRDNAAIPHSSKLKTDQSPWKWSLYAKKTIIKNFSVNCMVGRDHYRTTFPVLTASEMEPVVNRKTDWRWTMGFTMAL